MRLQAPTVLPVLVLVAFVTSAELPETPAGGRSAAEEVPAAPESFTAASPTLGEIDPPGATCSAQHGVAAYVCCDGEGGFTVCRGRDGGDRLLRGCIERHEEDHLAWFAEHLPDACVARPRGACRFEMTPHQFRDLECSGYSKEFRCLSESRALTNGGRRQLGGLMWRQRQLIREAESRFACTTGDW